MPRMFPGLRLVIRDPDQPCGWIRTREFFLDLEDLGVVARIEPPYKKCIIQRESDRWRVAVEYEIEWTDTSRFPRQFPVPKIKAVFRQPKGSKEELRKFTAGGLQLKNRGWRKKVAWICDNITRGEITVEDNNRIVIVPPTKGNGFIRVERVFASDEL